MCLSYSKQHTTQLQKRKTTITAYKIYRTQNMPDGFEEFSAPGIRLVSSIRISVPSFLKDGTVRSSRLNKKLLKIEIESNQISEGIHVYLKKPSDIENSFRIIEVSANPNDLIGAAKPYPTGLAGIGMQQQAVFLKVKVSKEVMAQFPLNCEASKQPAKTKKKSK